MWVVEAEKRGECLLPARPDHPQRGLHCCCILAHAITFAQWPLLAEIWLLPLHWDVASSSPHRRIIEPSDALGFHPSSRPLLSCTVSPLPSCTQHYHCPPQTFQCLTCGPTDSSCCSPAHTTTKAVLPYRKLTAVSMTFLTPRYSYLLPSLTSLTPVPSPWRGHACSDMVLSSSFLLSLPHPHPHLTIDALALPSLPALITCSLQPWYYFSADTCLAFGSLA